MQERRAQRLHTIRTNPGRGGCGIVGLAELTEGPSHGLIEDALRAISCMEHRGGCLEDTGDGAGLLFKVERSFFDRFVPKAKRPDPDERLVVGTVYLQRGERNVRELRREFDAILRRHGLRPLGWRKVPVEPSAVGAKALEDLPRIFQVFVGRGHLLEAQLPEALWRVRRGVEVEQSGYVAVPSLNPDTVVYKALATGSQLRAFFPDLRDPELTTRVVIGHRRYSTNTFSNWHLVQPFRMLAHNGEINTIRANTRAVRDVERTLGVHDVLLRHGSDSAQLDRAMELLVRTRTNSLAEAMRRMIPPSWREDGRVQPRQQRFLEASQRVLGTLGAWEGPAALLATDGASMVAMLDRMGLRPLRWAQLKTGRVVVASEMGAIPLDPAQIARDGQLEPGAMLVADLEAGTLVLPEDSLGWVFERSDAELRFGDLSTKELIPLHEQAQPTELPVRAQNAFGWTRERVQTLRETVKGSKEPVHSMGNDRPLAIFSENHSRLFSFLNQIVAVVTNPAIDPLREGEAVDLAVYLGRSPYLGKRGSYRVSPQHKLPHPILSNEDVGALLAETNPDMRAHVLDMTFEDTGDPDVLSERIQELAEEAVHAVRSMGAAVLVLSDRAVTRSERLPVPSLLTIGAVHRRLSSDQSGALRRDCSLVVESGELHEAHDVAALIAYGATAVNPYAMFHLAGDTPKVDPREARDRLAGALVGGLTRIMSKMGITTIHGYRGSGLFEAVGLSRSIIDYYLPDTEAQVGGITLETLYHDIVARAGDDGDKLARNRNVTVYRKEVTNALQMVARNGNEAGDYDRFAELLDETPPVYMRDLLTLESEAEPVPLEEVCSVEDVIRTTFRGAAMSHGALHATAHRAIAAAFNGFGSVSNSGEGGEDPRRNPGGEWESDRNRVRQVASGRFGVDAEYLVGADEIEIKIGQGAKPGEGGHLPEHKVTAEIARIRKTQEGVALISPPPHHDIYSIEDLAQLIRNLRQVNPRARIGVKVPSVTNLGTIVVGVAKAGADVITVSGCAGGTGAASSGSIFHAGLPLERGLAEAHQYLLVNGLRARVRLVADGGIKYGVDVVKILALGADAVGFGTALLVAENCVFCRGCNAGNCPVGITTNDDGKIFSRWMVRHNKELKTENLDARYLEAREGVTRYLTHVAEHVRRLLASLGLRHPAELVGRVDFLEQTSTGNPRWDRMDLGELITDLRDDPEEATPGAWRDSEGASAFNAALLEEARDQLAQRPSEPVRIERTLTEGAEHTIGATLAGAIARGELAEGARYELRFRGDTGQGFGFAATRGMELHLQGYANDTVGEVMSHDAKIVVVAPEGREAEPRPHLVGNAAAYGATGGTLFVGGGAGQRFGVRNSGATLVAESAGKYAFEYMTGGLGVILGRLGDCVGSGFTGGEIVLMDADGDLRDRLHPDAVIVPTAPEPERLVALQALLAEYVDATGSPVAQAVLDDWESAARAFRWVRPRAVLEAEATHTPAEAPSRS